MLNKTFFLLCGISLSFFGTAYSLPCIKGTVTTEKGYRQDELRWNIAAPDGDPNILSELTWTNLKSFHVSGTTELELCERFVLQASAAVSFIDKGDGQDSDYDANDRTQESLRSLHRVKGDYHTDYSVALGYRMNYRFQITPFAGYSRHTQWLDLVDGVTVLALPPNTTGPIIGLDSSYRTRWESYYLGLDVEAPLLCLGVFTLSGRYHRCDYQGLGHWNLRTNFLEDFRHEANGDGYFLKGSLVKKILLCWSLGVSGQWTYFEATKGRDKTLLDVVGVPTLVESALNEVVWKSWAVTALIQREF
jgi:hypothetical protein